MPVSLKNQNIERTYAEGRDKFSPDDLNKLMEDAEKIQRKGKKLGSFFQEFTLLWELLGDYKKGRYTQVPWKFIAAAGFAVFYLLNPFDIVPDVLPFFGYCDDASVFGLVLAGFKSELEAYRRWKADKGKL